METTTPVTVVERLAELTTLSTEVVQNAMVAFAAVVLTLVVVFAIKRIKRPSAYRHSRR